MTPKASIVVPAYNNADFIAATLDSILAQDYPNLEVIVADHSSPDATMAVLESYDDPRLTVTTTPAGGGAPANWSRVTELATGEYVKLVCGDDLLTPTAVSAQVEALEANPTAVLAASKRDLVDARGKVFVRARGLGGLSGLVPGPQAVRTTVRSGTNIFGEPACVTFRREALMASGGWDGTKAYYIDAGTYARVLAHGDAVMVDQSLAAFRVSASQWSVRLMNEQQQQAAEFHAEQRERFPDVINDADVRHGDRMARLQAWQRRAAYIVLGRRMRAKD